MMALLRSLRFTKGARTVCLQGCGHTFLRQLSVTTPIATPILSVAPTRALVDEKMKVLVENLPPLSPVTIHSLHHSDDQDDWEAYGHYVSDHRGTVSASEDLSFGGTYTGKEPMGLLWSMHPVPGSREGLRLRKSDVCSPMLVNISVYSGHEGFREQSPLAAAVIERWYMAPGVQRIDTREKGVEGTLFLPPDGPYRKHVEIKDGRGNGPQRCLSGPGPFPGLIDIWGGGGGLLEYRSALLASRGYAALALGYLKAGELGSTDVESTYFETAFNILKNHPQIISDKVGALGLSLGSIVTLHLTAESSVFKPCCCVCVSGSHAFSVDKTIKGVKKELAKYFSKIYLDDNNHQVWRDMGLALLSVPTNKVDVGKINCPLLLVNGVDDQNWPTVEFAKQIAEMMGAAGKEHLLSRVEYPGAGHLIEPPFSPHFRATNINLFSSTDKMILLWGGQTKPHSDAQEDSWRKILSFLRDHLYCSPKSTM